jgi:ABC-2 type transport system ATP-binding protein
METYVALLKQLEIPPNKLFKEFSHGMKKKLVLAIALSHRAKLLILDEPTSSLDPPTRDEILSMLMEFTRDEDHTVLLSSHIISDLEKICDYIVYIHHGKILLSSEKERIAETYALAACAPQHLVDIEPASILGMRRNPYGVTVLMKREHVPAFIEVQQFSLEEMMILLAKQGDMP